MRFDLMQLLHCGLSSVHFGIICRQSEGKPRGNPHVMDMKGTYLDPALLAGMTTLGSTRYANHMSSVDVNL
jgi:hypothetical protein